MKFRNIQLKLILNMSNGQNEIIEYIKIVHTINEFRDLYIFQLWQIEADCTYL
jgi:hypothetical protein